MDIRKLSQIFADSYSTTILLGSAKTPKTANQLSRECNIPIAACYRRIQKLIKAGLLRCVDEIPSKRGRKIRTYTSQMKNVQAVFEKGKFKVRIKLTNGNTIDYE